MKKVIFVAAFAVAGFVSQAQTTFGIKAGLTIANLTGDDADGFSSKAGGYGGAFANIPVSTMFSVQPEVLFSMEGAKFDGGKLNLNYINIPVMLQYHSSGFVGELGPQIGILASAKQKIDGVGDSDAKDFLKSSSFAINFGAGYKLDNGFGFGVRYSLGLSNIAKESDASIKTSVFSVGLSYAFGGSAKSND